MFLQQGLANSRCSTHVWNGDLRSEFYQFIQDPGYPQDLVLHLEQIVAWHVEEMFARTQET